MTICATCGNDYDAAFSVMRNGEIYAFDSFECAIHKLAPRCGHCEVPIIGHGVQAGEHLFCCNHCATRAGTDTPRDRASAQPATAPGL